MVAADGPRSATRTAAGLRTVRMPYNQRGVVATVATAAPHDVAWQRFLATGPLALLPTRYKQLLYVLHQFCDVLIVLVVCWSKWFGSIQKIY